MGEIAGFVDELWERYDGGGFMDVKGVGRDEMKDRITRLWGRVLEAETVFWPELK